MEAVRTRKGQYQLTLLRDLLADYKPSILDAPCFIEKATLDLDNPLIFNKEDFSVNQIKTQEIPLKDQFKLPWAVAYIGKEVGKTITLPDPDIAVDITLNSLDQFPLYQYKDSLKSRLDTENYEFFFNRTYAGADLTVSHTYDCCWTPEGNPRDPRRGTHDERFPYGCNTIGNTVNARRGFISTDSSSKFLDVDIAESVFAEVAKTEWNFSFADYLFPSDPSYIVDPETIWQHDGTVIFITDTGSYYRVKVKSRGTGYKEITINPDSALGIKYKELASNCDYLSGNEYKEPIGVMSATYSNYELVFEELANNSLSINIPTDRAHTANAPYDIIAFPVGNYSILKSVGGTLTDISRATEEIAYRFAAALSDQLGEAELFDLQLLPYAPISQSFIYEPEKIRYSEGEFCSLLEDEDYAYAALFYITEASFTTLLYTDGTTAPLKAVDIPAAKTAIELKIQNECKEYRIVSPNYASVFSINAAKNNGLKNFKADCTYKPFTPYIKVYPEFNLLYGKDFGDARGMIISGDFSLPRTTNQWINYQLQNKNFLNSFDRQIDNLEFNNRLGMIEAKIGAAVGTAQGAVSTGMIGNMAGGPVGLGIGAAAGGVASLVGGIADVAILKQRQAETLDFTKDQFGYQLGNIKARPDAVAKVSAFDINSKIWPFLEVYECTPIEEEAFRQKLKWNGMTVGVIGTIRGYLRQAETYIKGKIIRLSDLNVDYHLAVEIANEIYKGVFI